MTNISHPPLVVIKITPLSMKCDAALTRVQMNIWGSCIFIFFIIFALCGSVSPAIFLARLYYMFATHSGHYSDVIMGGIASQITSLTTVYSTVYSDADQRKHQSSALLAFVRGIHRCPVNSPHRGPVTRKMCPFDDVIMSYISASLKVWSPLVNIITWYPIGITLCS